MLGLGRGLGGNFLERLFGMPGVGDGFRVPDVMHPDPIEPGLKMNPAFGLEERLGGGHRYERGGRFSLPMADMQTVEPIPDSDFGIVKPEPNPFFNRDPDYYPNANPAGATMAPPTTPKPTDISFSYANQNATRNQRLTPQLEYDLDITAQEVYGPGAHVKITSGGQPSSGPNRVGSHRHDDGRAGDVEIYRPDGTQVTGNDLISMGERWRQKNIGGVGMEMKGGRIHLDQHKTPPPNGTMAWNYAGATPEQQQFVASNSGVNPSKPGGNATLANDAFQINAYIDRVIGVESGGNARAKNPLSSAGGLGQFTDATWRGMMQKFPKEGFTPDGKFDPTQARRATYLLTTLNMAELKSAGITINPANLYAAHFLGGSGAKKVLMQQNNVRMDAVVGPGVIKANPFLANMTVGDFKAWTNKKMGTLPAQQNFQIGQNMDLADADGGKKKFKSEEKRGGAASQGTKPAELESPELNSGLKTPSYRDKLEVLRQFMRLGGFKDEEIV